MQVPEADELTDLLKQALSTSNAHVSNAALACLPPYFPLITASLRRPSASTSPSSSPSGAASAPPPALVHSLKHAFVALLPLQQLGDSKERVRELAREALVSAGRTALSLGINAGVNPPAKDKEGPWAYLSRSVHESGFSSKNARAREQVRPPPTTSLPALSEPPDHRPSRRSITLSPSGTPQAQIRPTLSLLSAPSRLSSSLSLAMPILPFAPPPSAPLPPSSPPPPSPVQLGQISRRP